MIKRLVKMTFREECIEDFQSIFDERKERIRDSEGCHSLELLWSEKNRQIFFTLSLWESEKHLDLYRHSDLFEDTWAITKAMFAEKPEAWTLNTVVEL